ncbi:MAG: NAD(P)/FAD-dependent oxidoreductase [Methanoregulaceae archaeon]|nr:NAD(P)/FAD-dependent oxidoreductase [Methanoregulaceae archaeon]
MTNTTRFDIVIIGAGPAGLFCAATAGAAGKTVLILEKNSGPGKKLLLSGSGQCNITHDGPVREFLTHYGPHGAFLKPALMNFPNTALIAFFKERGLDMVTTDRGKVFPVTLKSADILRILEKECVSCGVAIHYNEPVREVNHNGGYFSIVTRQALFSGSTLVISTGGVSYPGTGSTGDGYGLASSLGHTIAETAPALSPVIINRYPFRDLAGVSFDSLFFSLWREGKKIGSHQGDLLFTHQGLSGPGILDYSRFIHPGDTIRLSFIGPVRREQFTKEVSEKIAAHPVSHVKTVILYYKVPERLATQLLFLSGIPENLTCAHLTKEKRNILIANMLEFPLTVAKLGGFQEAMVTRGGVSLPEINPKTMESRQVPGLYFAGEVIDIDGDTGGYNLQAAFSTGYLAATSILKQPGPCI